MDISPLTLSGSLLTTEILETDKKEKTTKSNETATQQSVSKVLNGTLHLNVYRTTNAVYEGSWIQAQRELLESKNRL